MWSSHKDSLVEICSSYLTALSSNLNGSLECPPDPFHTEWFVGFPVFCNFWIVSGILLTRHTEFLIQKIWQWWWSLYICHIIYNVFYIHLYGSPSSFIMKDFLLLSKPDHCKTWGSHHLFASGETQTLHTLLLPLISVFSFLI